MQSNIYLSQETMCGACEREKASTMVQMYGQPYNQNTLKPVPPGETASLHRVRIDGIPLKLFYHFSYTSL